MRFSAQELIHQLRIASTTFPDYRTGENNRYAMEDFSLAAFSVFFTQCPSFLAYQRAMQEGSGRNNAKSLFTVGKIPGDTQIREVLDGVSPRRVFSIFQWCFKQLKETGAIEQFKSELGYLVALDGTQYFSSGTIQCKNCLTKTDKKTKTVTYYHTAITPVLVKPGSEHVVSLVPEFILPQDGSEKQDCENQAAKRWLRAYGSQFAAIESGIPITILGDDLYSRQPVIKTITGQDLHFILVCKRESHKWLYDWVDNLEEGKGEDDLITITIRKWNGTSHILSIYRFANHVPLKDSKDSLSVNWCDVTITNEETRRLVYHNAFITDYQITEANISDIVLSGRTRWKIENENNNTLKTKGYHFEHNYGHGKNYLSSLLTTLILIAFLFHTLLDLFCEQYRLLREQLRRQILFDDIRALTRYFYITSWDHLFSAMQQGLKEHFPLPATPYAILPGG